MNVEVKKILKFDIDQKIISIFHWKVSPTGAEIKWLVDEWYLFIYVLRHFYHIDNYIQWNWFSTIYSIEQK